MLLHVNRLSSLLKDMLSHLLTAKFFINSFLVFIHLRGENDPFTHGHDQQGNIALNHKDHWGPQTFCVSRIYQKFTTKGLYSAAFSLICLLRKVKKETFYCKTEITNWCNVRWYIVCSVNNSSSKTLFPVQLCFINRKKKERERICIAPALK